MTINPLQARNSIHNTWHRSYSCVQDSVVCSQGAFAFKERVALPNRDKYEADRANLVRSVRRARYNEMMRAPLRTIIFLLVAGISGCSSAPSKVELPILASYQSADSYGSVAVGAAPTPSGSASLTHFLAAAEAYARERGIDVKGVGERSRADSTIVVQTGADGSFEARLTRGGTELDRLRLPDLSEDYAQLMIDEMLLLWHPPDLGREPRSPVPEFALMPTSYTVAKDNFFSLMKNNVEHVNIGHQSWHQFESRTPTFTWEVFPRDWDLSPGMSKDDFKDVRYEFRLRPAYSGRLGFHSAESGGEDADGLTEPTYTVEEKLPFCAQYMWTVRAIFELNGVPRQTEWAGAYSLFPSMQEKPWFARRQLKRGLAAIYQPGNYFFTVRSPKSPFAEECVYR